MNRWIASTFDEFGRVLGIDGLAPGRGGGLVLDVGLRQLAFQVLDDAVVVMLATRLPPGDALAVKCRALGLCHRRHGMERHSSNDGQRQSCFSHEDSRSKCVRCGFGRPSRRQNSAR